LIGASLRDESRDYNVRRYCLERGVDVADLQLQRGGIIGEALLCGCVSSRSQLTRDVDRLWFEGPYGLLLTNAKHVPFLPLKGQLSLYRATDAVLNALK